MRVEARPRPRSGDRVDIGAYVGNRPALEESIADFSAVTPTGTTRIMRSFGMPSTTAESSQQKEDDLSSVPIDHPSREVRSRDRRDAAKCPGYAPEQGACMAERAGVSRSMHE